MMPDLIDHVVTVALTGATLEHWPDVELRLASLGMEVDEYSYDEDYSPDAGALVLLGRMGCLATRAADMHLAREFDEFLVETTWLAPEPPKKKNRSKR